MWHCGYFRKASWEELGLEPTLERWLKSWMNERPTTEYSRLVQRQLGKRGRWQWTGSTSGRLTCPTTMTVVAVSTAGLWCSVDQQAGTPEWVRAETNNVHKQQQYRSQNHRRIGSELQNLESFPRVGRRVRLFQLFPPRRSVQSRFHHVAKFVEFQRTVSWHKYAPISIAHQLSSMLSCALLQLQRVCVCWEFFVFYAVSWSNWVQRIVLIQWLRPLIDLKIRSFLPYSLLNFQ